MTTSPADEGEPGQTSDCLESEEDAVALVHRVVESQLGAPPLSAERETSGATNVVFSIEHQEGQFVVRLCPAAGQSEPFTKELWVMARAGESGIPVPDVVRAGVAPGGVPFMVMRRARGQEATTHPERTAILKQLGAHAADINRIATTGFGDVFDWAPPDVPRRETWVSFLRDELRVEDRLELLLATAMLDESQIGRVRETLESAGDAVRTPTLNHGDLRLKNAIVSADGGIECILDWEKSVSTYAPEWELSLALHDLSVDEKEAFLEGYGMRPGEVTRYGPLLASLNVINYAPVIEAAAASNDREELERFRARLKGAFDLFSM